MGDSSRAGPGPGLENNNSQLSWAGPGTTTRDRPATVREHTDRHVASWVGRLKNFLQKTALLLSIVHTEVSR